MAAISARTGQRVIKAPVLKLVPQLAGDAALSGGGARRARASMRHEMLSRLEYRRIPSLIRIFSRVSEPPSERASFFRRILSRPLVGDTSRGWKRLKLDNSSCYEFSSTCCYRG